MHITLIECPRDAWQGMSIPIPAPAKAGYLRALISAGFRHIDAVSFVSPRAIPQVADSEQVLADLSAPSETEIIGIVMNRKGAERALATRAVSTLGFPFSLSPTFAMRNQNQTPEQSRTQLREIQSAAQEGAMKMTVYLSMAFGNPYGDEWSQDAVLGALDECQSLGITSVSLADTSGQASLRDLGEIFAAALARFPQMELGAHLHGKYEDAGDLVLTALDAGCTRFDCAIGGFGGCPFALDQGKRVGNLPTEEVLRALERRGVTMPITAKLPELLNHWRRITHGAQ